MKAFSIAMLSLLLAGAIFARAKENPFGGSEGDWHEEYSGAEMPSKWAAAGLSFLVPGAGQLYLGNKTRARYFLAAEGAIWGAFTGYTVYGNWQKEEYRNFAAIHAGAHPAGKDDSFFENLLDFQSRDEYNYWMHLIYRDEIPLYPTTDEFYWDWESDDAMDEYADMRSSSEKAYRSARTVLGVALINRVISVVDVFRTDLVSQKGQFGDAENRFMPQAYIGSSSDGTPCIGMRLTKNF